MRNQKNSLQDFEGCVTFTYNVLQNSDKKFEKNSVLIKHENRYNYFDNESIIGPKRSWSLSDILYELMADDNAEEKDFWK